METTSMDTQSGFFSRPYVLLTVTALFWAGNAIAGKYAVGHVGPFTVTTLRWLIAVLVLLPFSLNALRADWPLVRRHWLFLLFCGAVGFALFNNLLYLALTRTTAINAGIIQASMPLFVFVLNFLWLRIPTTPLQALGFALTLYGVALTAAQGDLSTLAEAKLNLGDALMLIAVAAYGVYSVALVKKPPMHWLTFLLAPAFFAFVVSIPFTIWETAQPGYRLPDAQGWAVVVYTALFPAILSQIFWVRGLELIGANRGGVFINLVPIFASALAVLLLDEQFRQHHLIALALVIAGVWMSQKRAQH
jgi:drug/metabolite transporter (DMT)-like permease